MATLIIPTWDDLDGLVQCAGTELFLVTPFFNEEGISRVFDTIKSDIGQLAFWTKLSPSDWVKGFSAPDELLALFELLQEKGCEIDLGIYQRLHAKVYAADRNRLLFGSANLTAGGFGGNFEVMTLLESEEARDAVNLVRSTCEPLLTRLSVADLKQWVKEAKATIEQERAKANEADSSGLSDVQRMLDNILKFGGKQRTPGRDLKTSAADSSDFVTWLRKNQELRGASILLDHYDNASGQNRQGHFRQSFFGVLRFFEEYPEYIDRVADFLRDPQTELYQLKDVEPVRDAWYDHLDNHATDQSSDFSYPTIRATLPSGLGGTLTGGGGMSGTVQRMFPVVAEYLRTHRAI